VHGDLGQGAREQALRAFRSGKIDVLVATDVAARGIDVEGVTHVINYQCPEDEKTYVHRIGRTGRAGRTGVAVTLVDWDEMPRWKMISDALNLGKPEPVETYSTSDHLFSDLDIPAGSTGRLPLGLRTRAGLDAEPEENLKGEKKTRKRRRGGRAGEAGQPAESGAGNGGSPGTASGSGSGSGNGSGSGDEGGTRPRKRRRSRGGVSSATASADHGTTSEASAEVTAGAPAESSAPAGDADRPRRRRRRRTGAGESAESAPAE
jgi:superfamily II DNA/RNA helicase